MTSPTCNSELPEKILQDSLPYKHGLEGEIYFGLDWMPIDCSSTSGSPGTTRSLSFDDAAMCVGVLPESKGFKPTTYGQCMERSFSNQSLAYSDGLHLLDVETEDPQPNVSWPDSLSQQVTYDDYDGPSGLGLLTPRNTPYGDEDKDAIPKSTTCYIPNWNTVSGSKSKTGSSRRSSSQRGVSKPKTGKKQPHSSRTKSLNPDSRIDVDASPLDSKRNHNLTEKRYRTRLNGQFETLLLAVPTKLVSASRSCNFGSDSQKISKSEVLILARQHIRYLEDKHSELERENQALRKDLERLKEAWEGIGTA